MQLKHQFVHCNLHSHTGKQRCKQKQASDNAVARKLKTIQHIRKRCADQNRYPQFALRKASIKFWKFSQLAGISMTLVCAYSVSVLNAVITHDTMGSTATKAKNTSEKYFKIVSKTLPIFCNAVFYLRAFLDAYFASFLSRRLVALKSSSSAFLNTYLKNSFCRIVAMKIMIRSTTAIADASPTFCWV